LNHRDGLCFSHQDWTQQDSLKEFYEILHTIKLETTDFELEKSAYFAYKGTSTKIIKGFDLELERIYSSVLLTLSCNLNEQFDTDIFKRNFLGHLKTACKRLPKLAFIGELSPEHIKWIGFSHPQHREGKELHLKLMLKDVEDAENFLTGFKTRTIDGRLVQTKKATASVTLSWIIQP